MIQTYTSSTNIQLVIYFYTQWRRVCTYTFMENAGKKMQVQIILF